MINYDDGYADSVQKHDSNICSLNIVQDNNNFLNIFSRSTVTVFVAAAMHRDSSPKESGLFYLFL